MLKVREANFKDVDLYYRWAIDNDVRKNSFYTEKFNYESHIDWFKHNIHSDNVKMFLFSNALDEFVGQVRIEHKMEENVIGISIDINYRGKGYGKEMLSMAVAKYLSEYPKRIIIAYIKQENTSSLKTFQNAGFKHIKYLKINNMHSIKLSVGK